uniref:Ion channel n=1 Tax=Panagrellus redivivus TaxID=6233 RepID=A0A7E4UN94_PANRE
MKVSREMPPAQQQHRRLSLTNGNLHRSLSSPDMAKSSDLSFNDQTEVAGRSPRKTPDGSVSFESFEGNNTNRLETPRVHLNGSLLSISNSHLMDSASKFMDFTRKVSISSQHSDSRRNLIFQGVGRTFQRTQNQLKNKTRMIHFVYFIALPLYTIIGAWIFQQLDGEHDDLLQREYEHRCKENRVQMLTAAQKICESSGGECFMRMQTILNHIESCYREWHRVNRTVTHPMSDYTNAIIYAFSVYTTIGYGNISATTMNCRIATVLYGMCGIPLFFAFIKEEGNQGRLIFIWVYKKIKDGRRWCCQRREMGNTNEKKTKDGPTTIAILVESSLEANPTTKPALVRRYSMESMRDGHTMSPQRSYEQRRVFVFGVLVFAVYLLVISAVFSKASGWDFFTSFYFLFNSVALIGFGDIFPPNPKVILYHMIFICLGVILFSMCYFILQEEIRDKALEASQRARKSISKYSQIMLSTKNNWSRRNSPAFDRSPGSDTSTFDRLRKRRQSAPAVTLNDTKTLLSFAR